MASRWSATAFQNVVVLEGGLGNQLFQFAYALGRTGVPAVLDDRRRAQWGQPLRLVLRDSAWRPVTQTELLMLGQCPRLPCGQRRAVRTWDRRLGFLARGRRFVAPDAVSEPAVSSAGRHLLEGYFQNESFVDPVRGLVINSLKPDLTARHELLPEGGHDVAISFRLGPDYQHFNVVLPDTYYEHALKTLTSDGDWTLHVCSDDKEAASRLLGRLGFDGRVVDHSESGAVEQLRVLASARRVAISNSTFAWWGAWIGDSVHHTDREVIAPDSWRAAPDSVPHSSWRRLPVA